MTSGAGDIAEVVADSRSIGSIQRLMAVAANSRNMRPGQHKRRLLMPRQCKSSYVEVVLRMTQLTAIEIRSPSELLLMYVLVAIATLRKQNLELGGAACWDMAFRAFHRRMLPAQREVRRAVILRLEDRFFEAVDRMAAFAFASVGPLGKLAVMRIGRVAVGTEPMCQMGLEISRTMATIAPQFNVFTEQRVLCLEMIESRREACLLPGNRVVTGFTALFESSLVNVGVTRRTLVELQSDELRCFSGNRRVALFALHSFMCAGQLEPGL